MLALADQVDRARAVFERAAGFAMILVCWPKRLIPRAASCSAASQAFSPSVWSTPPGRSPKPSSGLGLDHASATIAGIEPNASADAALVDRLRAGDADAFAEVVRAWSPMMLRVARTYVSTDASAQEVVQDAWLAIIRGLDRFEGRSSLRTWVLAILGNLGRSRGVREARTVPLSSLGPTDDDRPLVDPDRFRGPDDQWPRHWTPLGQPRPWPRSPEEEALSGEGRSELEHGLAPVARAAARSSPCVTCTDSLPRRSVPSSGSAPATSACYCTGPVPTCEGISSCTTAPTHRRQADERRTSSTRPHH
jgi:DNA-directed RNA polymerase specialized sigma24 family protein